MRVLLTRFGSRSTVAAMALLSILAMVGCASNNSSSSGSNVTATPSFTPGAGTYNKSQTVTIADTTQGAVLYCTTDGTTPTASSPQCAQPTTVFKTEFLQAIAVAPGQAPSAVASAGYTINPNATATPTFNPAGGTFTGAQTVTISDATSGANIYYTLDGTAPTANAAVYTVPLSIAKSTTLSAIAVASGLANSGVNSATYTIQPVLPAPTVSGLSPASANAGGAAFTLTVNGTNFVSGATILWNGQALAPTTVVSATQLTATVPVNLIASPGAVNVAVSQSSGISGVVPFTVNSVAPTITSLSPATTAAGGLDFPLTVNGTNFASDATVYWNSTQLATTPGTSTQLTATVPANLITTATTASITVRESAGTSPAATFTVTAPAVTITGLNPSSVNVGSGAFSLEVDGTNFVSGATVKWNGTALNTTFGGQTKLTAAVTADLVATAGPVSITVTELGGTSAAQTFTINALGAPTISSLSQVTASPGSTGVTLTIIGTNFDSSAVVNWGATPLTPTNITSTQLTVAIPDNLLTTVGTVNVTVKTNAGESASMTFTIATSISGTVRAGSTPLTSASVQLWAAGSTGYGMGATAVGSPVSTDATTGTFSIPYDCSTITAPGDQFYLVATGTQSGIVFMAALGSCANLSGSYIVNEATTVASAYALQQFMAADGTIGAAGNTTSYTGLSNAFKAVNNLVDLSAGTVRDHTPDYPTNLAGDPNILNNSTVPQARINTLANALNACASNGNGCSGLFSAATPGSGTAPGNTLAAILSIAQNPGNHVGDVLTVANGSTAFAPALPPSSTPNDWTLALTFTGGGLGFGPNFPLHPTTGNPSDPAKLVNSGMAIDAAGNVWVTGFVVDTSSGSSDFNSGMIAKFNNLGAPLTQASTATPTVSYGGYIPVKNGNGNAGTLASHGIAIDPSGNAWILGGATGTNGNTGPTTNGAMTEISPGTKINPGLATVLRDINVGQVGISPVAIDGLGNVWLHSYDSSSNGLIEEFDGKTGNMTLSNNGLQGANSFGYFAIQSLIFDSNASALWASDPATDTAYQIDPGTGNNTVDYFPNFDGGGYTPFVAGPAAADHSPGNVYGCETAGGQSLDVLNVSSPTILTSYPITTTRGCGYQMLMDGAGHIFTVTGGSGPGIIDELTLTGSGISVTSPASGYTGTSSGEVPSINPDPNAPPTLSTNLFAVSNQGIPGAAIDGSGNLWVLNADTGTTTSPGNVLVEYIGLAAPVVTPTSQALFNGQVGVRP